VDESVQRCKDERRKERRGKESVHCENTVLFTLDRHEVLVHLERLVDITLTMVPFLSNNHSPMDLRNLFVIQPILPDVLQMVVKVGDLATEAIANSFDR